MGKWVYKAGVEGEWTGRREMSGEVVRHVCLYRAKLLSPITSEELHIALGRGRATAPGDDGVPFSVPSLIAQVPNNPLLKLCNLSLESGTLPATWTTSTIISIPKPTSDNFLLLYSFTTHSFH